MKNLFLLLFLTLSLSLSAQEQGYFKNPVIRGDMADPSIIRIGNVYYATATSSEWAPFYPVFVSLDLVNWKQTGHIFDKKPEWTSNSFWAPELYYHNDKVYCYYTARRASDGVSYIGVATADSPTDEFTDHGLIVEYGTEAIDAFIYDDNGQLYISWKAYGLDKRPIEIIASKLSADGLRLEGEPFTLLRDDEGIGMEGQYHFKHGEYYYIIYSPHSCCGPGSDYDVYVARSKSYRGPYEKYAGNPILKGGGVDFISAGHGTAVETEDGRMFYMCHGYLKGDGFYNGRQPILQEIFMGPDKWPHFTTGHLASVNEYMPFDGVVQKPVEDFADDFESSVLKIDWTWNYPFSDIQAKIQKGKLSLNGTPKGDNKYGTALCLRSQTPNYSYETQIVNKNAAFKGLTMYGDDKNLVLWGIEGGKIVLKLVHNGKETILHEAACNWKNPYLKVAVEKGFWLSFYQSKDGANWEILSEMPLDARSLVRWDRVARPGLLHIGNAKQSAEYSYFKMTNLGEK